MQLPENCIEMILNASGKALASTSGTDVNVVPVSSIRVQDNKIILVNYFLNQTLKNILVEPKVSLAVWKGLDGYQIKAVAEYRTEGKLFEKIQNWIGETLPERVVKGILILTPTEIYDISAGEKAGTKIL